MYKKFGCNCTRKLARREEPIASNGSRFPVKSRSAAQREVVLVGCYTLAMLTNKENKLYLLSVTARFHVPKKEDFFISKRYHKRFLEFVTHFKNE